MFQAAAITRREGQRTVGARQRSSEHLRRAGCTIQCGGGVVERAGGRAVVQCALTLVLGSGEAPREQRQGAQLVQGHSGYAGAIGGMQNGAAASTAGIRATGVGFAARQRAGAR